MDAEPRGCNPKDGNPWMHLCGCHTYGRNNTLDELEEYIMELDKHEHFGRAGRSDTYLGELVELNQSDTYISELDELNTRLVRSSEPVRSPEKLEMANLLSDEPTTNSIMPKYVLECFRFRYVLENFGDFGAFLGAKLHRRIICLAVDVDLPTKLYPFFCLARGSCRGYEGMSINNTTLVLIDADAKMRAKSIS
ncbi:hypothetical protein F2Q69_00047835 [Brassica cretica]|uniref:Uncharacterized protein n=1 Tax=Brassica cretica TaxID=69181 RepID=A0A8S9PZ78_BRACR|nr:hypothetical protein F2Q69_00047835 [Brassica cretica]